MLNRAKALVTVLAATLALAACGGDAEPADPPDAVRTAVNGDEFNNADVAFATDMIPHHAQALEMVDLTIGRELDPEVAGLAEEIRAAQGPEIEQLVDWLTGWDEQIPETARDHENADGDGEMDMGDMPGMMSADEMTDLEEATGAAFEERWLEMMAEHHAGAIEMARAEQTDGAFAPAVSLAESIADSQEREVAAIEDLLGD